MSDQFTRWLCGKCGCDGIDSWNKAVFDGPSWDKGEQVPNPWILGMECWGCGCPCVVIYTLPSEAPRAVYSPIAEGERAYAYEPDAFAAIESGAESGEILQPSNSRDSDWSRGCLAARAQLQ